MTLPPANSPPFRFFDAECSYFTGKARPALRAKRLYFEEAVGETLAGTGCEQLFEYQPQHRPGKRDFKLVFEDA